MFIPMRINSFSDTIPTSTCVRFLAMRPMCCVFQCVCVDDLFFLFYIFPSLLCLSLAFIKWYPRTPPLASVRFDISLAFHDWHVASPHVLFLRARHYFYNVQQLCHERVRRGISSVASTVRPRRRCWCHVVILWVADADPQRKLTSVAGASHVSSWVADAASHMSLNFPKLFHDNQVAQLFCCFFVMVSIW